MDNINNIKVKDPRVLLRYHLGSKKLTRTPNKVELVEAVDDFIESIRSVLSRGGGGVFLLYQMKFFMKLVNR